MTDMLNLKKGPSSKSFGVFSPESFANQDKVNISLLKRSFGKGANIFKVPISLKAVSWHTFDNIKICDKCFFMIYATNWKQ